MLKLQDLQKVKCWHAICIKYTIYNYLYGNGCRERTSSESIFFLKSCRDRFLKMLKVKNLFGEGGESEKKSENVERVGAEFSAPGLWLFLNGGF
jgi:hypothetical protein